MAVTVLIAVLLAGGLLSFLVGSGGLPGKLAGKSAGQILALSMTAARAQGSVRFKVDIPGTGDQTFDVGRGHGKGVDRFGKDGRALLRVLVGVGYLDADTSFLTNVINLGQPCTVVSQCAGRWISFSSDSSYWDLVFPGATLSSALSEAAPSSEPMEPPRPGPFSLTSPRTMDGRQVVGIRGGLSLDVSEGISKGFQILYVSTHTPYLPVAFYASNSPVYGAFTGTFSQWGEAVSVTAPDRSISAGGNDS